MPGWACLQAEISPEGHTSPIQPKPATDDLPDLNAIDERHHVGDGGIMRSELRAGVAKVAAGFVGIRGLDGRGFEGGVRSGGKRLRAGRRFRNGPGSLGGGARECKSYVVGALSPGAGHGFGIGREFSIVAESPSPRRRPDD